MSDSIWRATEADILRLAKSLGLVDDTTTEEAPPPEVEETPAPAVNARSSVEAVSRIRKQIDSIVIPDLADVCGVGRDQISVIVCPPDVELDWNDADVEAGMWVVDWQVEEGATVRVGQPIAVLIGCGGNTVIALEASIDGVVDQTVGKSGATLRPGDVLAVIKAHTNSDHHGRILPFGRPTS